MTKTITLAIFMVVLVLGMVTKETQGEENQCYEYISTPQENCEGLVCAHDCTMKHGGNGVCVDTTSTTCICTYEC
ncbi:S locus-related glycoprotein 1 binding pollen coat protein [Arabidopsis thaliana x Arabidopsis arenosa]|uniref:S locus-related glycoprotein 1 binding pollen coat protein n=1 Tax=Arabidopsis thaliana x Arabidopsis arenosa TaxID=1240361 RepID=A0A8T1ZST8_9BRAS|nr:S locus-related glycoprotein 1 binding pollen coat protein [Arabidopsis thaliana x Arabidopsis arenosa]